MSLRISLVVLFLMVILLQQVSKIESVQLEYCDPKLKNVETVSVAGCDANAKSCSIKPSQTISYTVVMTPNQASKIAIRGIEIFAYNQKFDLIPLANNDMCKGLNIACPVDPKKKFQYTDTLSLPNVINFPNQTPLQVVLSYNGEHGTMGCVRFNLIYDNPPVPPKPVIVDDVTFLKSLMNKADTLIAKAKEALKKFQNEKNYFAKVLENELWSLISVSDRLKKEQININNNNPFLRSFLYQTEDQINKIEIRIQEIIDLGQKGTDPSYIELLLMLDALVQRAYADIGKLVTKGFGEKAEKIKQEIVLIEQLEAKLKSVNFQGAPEEAQKIVEQLLEHEKHIEEELYRIENEISF